jgi:nanoRNase/pAp phosphatase (c-di-AMP/oligoRNAs hydrolase)
MRLVTRSDFDGLVCAMILKEVDLIDDIKFVHPKDVQDGKIELGDNDITTNLPYCENVFLCFDHHESELERNSEDDKTNWIIDGDAKSVARVVYNYYKEKGHNLERISDEILNAVDKSDSADFTEDEILNPTGWNLLSFIMDARTGLGRFHNFRISNYDLMMELIKYCVDHTIDEVLELPDVKERVNLYFEHQEQFKEQIQRVARIEGDVVVLDLRNEETIYTGNRFLVYALYPQVKYSIHVVKGYQGLNTAVMIGRSIINKAGSVDIGKLCLSYGGGGHENAGTCQLANDEADKHLVSIIDAINI